jgi:cytochrome c553
MNRIIATIAVALASVSTAFAAGEIAKPPAIVSQVCAACHGIDGNSPLPANPNLAGQHPEYLAKQLAEFKSGIRKNAVMTGMTSGVSTEDIRSIAAFYGAQKSKDSAARDKDLAAKGRALYRGGIASKGVAACAGCHSPNGAGIPSQYPRLAGQHADYVSAQLKAFRAGDRANDANQMMRDTAAKLSDAEINALAEYIAGLR